ncbi:MAG: NAD(P)H-hydrate epimerase [Cyanobium sp.]
MGPTSLSSLPTPSWPGRDADHLLVTAQQMQDLEAELFASGLPVEALMEKASLAMARRLLSLATPAPSASAPWSVAMQPMAQEQEPELEPAELARLGAALRERGAVVLVGPGHNGGDGLVLARELHLAGIPVQLWCPFERRKPLTERHWSHARWLGIPELPLPPDPHEGCLWIDALFGNGQRRAPGDALESLLEQRQQRQGGLLVALDVPTGLCSDTGKLLGSAAATASLTLCLGLIRQGLVQDSALAWVGRLERIDLGLSAQLLTALPLEQPLALGGRGCGQADALRAPRPLPPPAAGKYGRGRLLVIAGSERYPGAGLLALHGASASGCGSLRASLAAAHDPGVSALLPHVVPEPQPFASGALTRLDALLIGPGLGAGTGPARAPGQVGDNQAAARAMDGEADGLLNAQAWQELLHFAGTLVIDADGLNRISADWLCERVGSTWITPHAAEFARLFADLAGLPPLEAASSAARRCGIAVVLKGAHSVVAAPDGRRWQVVHSCAASARAGLGDVLAGYAAGLASRAAACFQPDPALLALAALDHARAACRAIRRHGEGGATPLAVAQELQRATG